MRILFVYNEVESLGVQYLSAALRRAGHETALVFDPRLFDFFREEYNSRPLKRLFSFENDAVEKAAGWRPDVVGFSMLTANSGWCGRIATGLRKALPGAVHVAGGYHATANARAVLETGLFDYVVRGEAEDGLVELVNSLEDGRPDLAIPNLAYRDGQGRYVENPLRPYEQDLDRYGRPDKELWYGLGGAFKLGLMQEWHRGCPWGCTFCGNNYYRRIYFGDRKDYMYTREFLRARSVDDVLAELHEFKARYNPRLMRVNDDDLCADEPWLKELADRMTDAERIPYKCFVIPNNVNERTIEYLKRTGCEQIQMGVQSLNPSIRKMIGRPNTDEQISHAIDLIHGAGIGLYVDQIFGLPGETEDDCRKIERFYDEHPADVVSIYWLDIWNGAEILEQAVNAGTITQEQASTIARNMEDHRCISTVRAYHNDFARPYAKRMEVRNHYPRWLAKTFLATGLWHVAGAPFVLRQVRGFYAALHTWKPDHFPPAKHGYDLSWARFPRFLPFWAALKMKSWIARKNLLPLVSLPPVGLPRKQRPRDEQLAPRPREVVSAA